MHTAAADVSERLRGLVMFLPLAWILAAREKLILVGVFLFLFFLLRREIKSATKSRS